MGDQPFKNGGNPMCRSPLACIVPPGLLKRLAMEGSARERRSAVETLAIDASIRQARAETAGRRSPAERALGSLLTSAGSPRRFIHDQKGATTSIGAVVRGEGQPPTDDVAVNQAYDGLGHTYAFYWDAFNRDSIDGAGMALHGMVHFGTKYNNAFWDGQEMVFGDGDGVLFHSFTSSLDVIGHELTHGVTQFEANLVYSGQSGALNESISDVFGSMVKQYALQQTTAKADWLIGPDCVGDKLKPALRSMKAPGTANAYDDQPADMDHYVKTTEDNGGVHTNSGIPNLAFATTAIELGRHSWDKAGPIWYAALRDPRLRPNSGFRSFANATIRQAGVLYGTTSKEALACRHGWEKVKVL
jgi:Zn-dependent metalloprotease